ncbi:MAG: SusC/RagA family TonB-linked outer membrane protein [Gemmatimonadales bacterium]
MRMLQSLRKLVALAPTLLLLGATPLSGQDARGTITGTVRDAVSDQMLADVRVHVQGTQLQGITDVRGQYRITNVPAGQVVLQVRRIGYRALEKGFALQAGEASTQDFALNASVVTLEEIVISGTAGDQKRRAQAASVSEISVSDLTQTAPVRTFEEVLQSRVPGVSVTRASGTSGTNSQIRIRGGASISLSNEPIIYVDGIRINSSLSNLFFTGGQQTTRLGELNPKDFESIEVVKGPAAATLYGADASAGVIQIITKKGKPGATRFNQTIALEYNNLDADFAPPSNYAFCSATLIASTSPNPLCRGMTTTTLVSDNPLLREDAFRNGGTYALQWTGQGGGGNFGYYLSGAYENENGTLPNNGFDRRNGRLNFNWTPSTKVALDVGVGMGRANFELPDNDNNVYGYLGGALLGSPLTRRDDGVESNNGWFGFARDVPAIQRILNQQQTHRTIATAQANYTPLEWWSHKVVVGADWTRDEIRRFLEKNSRGSYQGISNTGDISERRAGFERYTLDYLTNARVNTGAAWSHNFSAGFQLIDTRNEDLTATGQGLVVNSNNTVSAASSRSAAQNIIRQRQVGFLGQWQVSWKDRLTVTAGGRLDANSSFGDVREWFFLPKLGVSYVISDEPWWNVGAISTLRFRGAWGQTGRSPLPGAALTTLVAQPYIDASVVQPGAIPASPGNDSLKAERGVEYEAGFDAGFLDERVGVEFTYYRKTSKDLLLQQPLPPSLGFPVNPFVNIGKVRNQGLEVAFTAQPILKRNLSWDVRLNLSTLDDEVVDMGDIAAFGTLNRFMEGASPGVFVGNRIRSVDLATGRVVVSDSLEEIGPLLPRFEGNFSTNLTLFRNFRIQGSLDWKTGHYIYNLTDFFRETQLVRSNRRLDTLVLSREERLRRYGNPTPGQPAFVREGVIPGFPATATVNEVRDEFVQSADFLKLRDISVTYTLPSKWSGYFRSQSASITLAGQNLATWTDYEGFDPEILSNATANFNRTDFLTLPPSRRFVVKFNLQF